MPRPDAPDETVGGSGIQRVPGGRRRPIAVAAVALLVVGALTWKPWASGAVPSPLPSAPIAALKSDPSRAVASASPALLASTVPGVVGGSLQTEPLPTAITSFSGPSAACVYPIVPAGHSPLSAVIVSLGDVLAAPPPGARSARLHVALEVNGLAQMFSADWSRILTSPASTYRLPSSVQYQVSWLPIHDGTLTSLPASVVRAVVVVSWLDRHHAQLALQQTIVRSYSASDELDGSTNAEGCRSLVE